MFVSKTLLVAVFLAFGFAGCDKPEDSAAKYLTRGNAYYEQGDYARARVEYKNAARIAPTNAEIRYRLGLVDEAQGDFFNAFGNFMKAEQQDGAYVPAKLKLAQYYLAGEQYETSEQKLNEAFAHEPENAEAHALLGALLLRKKDHDGAEKSARFALEKNPANVTAFSVLTGLYSALGDEAKAGEVLDKGIARNPQDVSLLLLKAALYEKSMNLPKIVETYEALFKLRPADTIYRANLGAIYVKAGKIDEAEAALRAGVAAQPDNWTMKRVLASFLGDHRGVEAAEKEIRGYMQAYPKNDELYFWLADLFIAHNATDRAVELLEQLVSKRPLDNLGLNARTSLARINFVKGDRALAEKLIAAVLEKNPGHKEALFTRANIAFDRGYYDKTATDLRTILRDDPKTKGAYQLLAESLLNQGRLDLAIDTLNQLMDVDPSSLGGRVRLAQLYSLRGEPKRALEALAIVTKADPAYPFGWESTARVAINMKDWANAEKAINALSAIDGFAPTALFLQGMMAAEQDKIDEAVSLYKQVIGGDPSSPVAEHALGALTALYHARNRSDEAALFLETLPDGNLYVMSLLGEAYIKLGKKQEAAAMFDKAIASNATFADPYINRAKIHVADSNIDQAIDVLKKGYEAFPTNLVAPMMAANLLEKQGQHHEAVALYDDVLARNTGVDIAANNLAQLIADYHYADAAALEKARKTAERFAGSTNPLMLDTLGWVYYRQGNLQLAQTVLERAMSLAGDKAVPQMHYHYGAVLLRAGNAELAKTHLQKATAEGTDYHGLDEAKALLSGL